MDESDWRAWYNDEPGSGEPDQHLYVSGKVEVDHDNDEVTLEPSNAGTGDGKTFALKVVVTHDGIELPQIDTKDASWREEVGRDFETLRVDLPDGNSYHLTIDHVC